MHEKLKEIAGRHFPNKRIEDKILQNLPEYDLETTNGLLDLSLLILQNKPSTEGQNAIIIDDNSKLIIGTSLLQNVIERLQTEQSAEKILQKSKFVAATHYLSEIFKKNSQTANQLPEPQNQPTFQRLYDEISRTSNDLLDEQRNPLLIQATMEAMFKEARAIKLLIDAKIDLNVVQISPEYQNQHHRDTALHILAKFKKRPDIFELLVESGADYRTKDSQRKTVFENIQNKLNENMMEKSQILSYGEFSILSQMKEALQKQQSPSTTVAPNGNTRQVGCFTAALERPSTCFLQ